MNIDKQIVIDMLATGHHRIGDNCYHIFIYSDNQKKLGSLWGYTQLYDNKFPDDYVIVYEGWDLGTELPNYHTEDDVCKLIIDEIVGYCGRNK